ncbi:MAG: sigma-54 dependent transcriptional regulator [Muribaculaceae bacterium]|nr:sigma-54 dependent transcriptional regulator [Muribaculaceae bacterium]
MILIVDDDKVVRLSLGLLLKTAGYETIAVDNPADALEAARRHPSLKLVISDMNFSCATSGQEGIELLRRLKVLRPEVPVMLITAWGSIPLAVEGMRFGAFDFITKPWNNHTLLQRVATALSLTGHDTQPGQAHSFDRSGIIGESPQLNAVLETAARVAPTDAPVLILGENGTGKELVAQAIHNNSRRRAEPLVMVNLGGISQSLFESEMFGHVKGAYTGAATDRKGRFELADKGTIFLDEIGDLDLSCQVKLLRVLQQHTFERLGESHPRRTDIRVIAATNADLWAKVHEHTFREDLLYRINLITLRLPALRERRSDIPLLAKHFAHKFAMQNAMQTPQLTADALEFLAQLPWPGNIRELKNLVERTILVCAGSRLDAADFRNQYHPDSTPLPATATQAASASLEDMEREAIAEAMNRFRGNISKVAAELGVTRQTLYRKIEKYGINR